MERLTRLFTEKLGHNDSYVMTQSEDWVSLAVWKEGMMLVICRNKTTEEMINFLENPNLEVLCANLSEKEERKKFLKKIEDRF